MRCQQQSLIINANLTDTSKLANRIVIDHLHSASSMYLFRRPFCAGLYKYDAKCHYELIRNVYLYSSRPFSSTMMTTTTMKRTSMIMVKN